jgi:hypothetical protein
MLRWFLLIPFAIAVAVLAACIGLMVAAAFSPELAQLIGNAGQSLFRMIWEMGMSGEDPSPVAKAVLSRVGMLMLAVTVFPVLLVAFICDIFRLPSGLLQVSATGALTALLPVAMLGLNRAPSGSEASILGGLFLVGVLAGTVYWAIAGRGAARARPLPATPQVLPPSLPAGVPSALPPTSPPPSSGS